MVSWVPQIIFPPLVALAFMPSLPRKWVMALAPTTYLEDLDYLVPGEHRVWTHTLLIPALLVGGVWWLHRRRKSSLQFWQFAAKPGWPVALTLIAYFFAAHAIMDVFTGGVALFWPLLPTNFYFDFSIDLDLVHRKVIPQSDAGATPQPFPLDEAYPWLTTEHSAILAFMVLVLVVAGVVSWLRMRRRKASELDPAPPQSDWP